MPKTKFKYAKFCYTGIGAKKNPNHTQKQFMRVMNKTFSKQCREHKKSLRCKSCKKYRKFTTELSRKSLEAMKKDKTHPFQYSEEDEKQTKKMMEKCNKCKSNRTRRSKNCNIKDYVEYAGPDIGECPKDIAMNP